MNRLVIDSWAWIEYMDGSGPGRKVDLALTKNSEAWTSVITIAEVVSKYRRKGLDETPILEAISTLSRAGSVGSEDAKEAGRIQSEARRTSPNFSLADAFVLQLARKVGGKVLTGDPGFRGIKEAEFIG